MMRAAHDFHAAAAAGLITADQAEKLASFFLARAESAADATSESTSVATSAATARPRFDLAHLLWYFGALIVIGAMGTFSTLAFAAAGGGALLITAVTYAVAFVYGGDLLWKKDLKVPGGLLIAMAVAMTPMAVFGVQEMTGAWGALGEPGKYNQFYDYVKGGWLPMEIATLIAALIAARLYPFGFIAMIAALMLWFMSMDLTPWVARIVDETWGLRAKVSMWFGLGLIIFAWFVDVKQRKADYAFWLHLAAITAFWGGLMFQNSNSEWSKFMFFLLNIGLMLFAVYLSRRVYAVYGAIGVMVYLGYLSSKIFKDWLLFPFALSAIGLAVIGLGLLYHRNSARITAAIEAHIPAAMKRLRPMAA